MSQSSLFSDILETASPVTETDKLTHLKNPENSKNQASPNKPIAIFKEQFIQPKDDLIDILAKKSPLFLNTDSDVAKLPPKSILKQEKTLSELPKQQKTPNKSKKSSDKKRKPNVEDDPLGLFKSMG